MSGKPSLKGKRKKGSGRKPRPRVRVQTSRYGRELIVDETFASFQRPGGASEKDWYCRFLQKLVLQVLKGIRPN